LVEPLRGAGGRAAAVRDHSSNPEWWQDFVTNLGKTDVEANPNSRIRVVEPGAGS
jgi:hypothetical protein